MRIPCRTNGNTRSSCLSVIVLVTALCAMAATVTALVYTETVSFELAQAVSSLYTPIYPQPSSMTDWQRCSSSAQGTEDGGKGNDNNRGSESGDSAESVFEESFQVPMEALQAYYKVITEEPFLLDYGGTISVALESDGVMLAAAKYRSYAENYILPQTTASSATLGGSDSDKKGGKGLAAHAVKGAAAAVSTPELDMKSVAFFFYNQPRLHCLYNAPVLLDILDRASNKSSEDCSCAAFVPSIDALRPGNPAQLLTDAYMTVELNLQVMVFDADTWYRLTNGSRQEESATSAKASLASVEKKDSAAAAAAAAAQEYPYNLLRDPSKVCTAPALYTVPLAPLFLSYLNSDADAPGYYTPASSPNITHNYPPVRIVVVVAQCSAIPVSARLSVSLTNNGKQGGSAQFYYDSIMYFVFMVGYAIIFIIFLVMIVRCEKRPGDRAAKPKKKGASDDEKASRAQKGAEREGSTHEEAQGEGRERREGQRSRLRRRRHVASSEDSDGSEDSSDNSRDSGSEDSSSGSYHDLDDGGRGSIRHGGRSQRGSERRKKGSKGRRKEAKSPRKRTVSAVGVTRAALFFAAVERGSRRAFLAMRAWWLASHTDIMFPTLQWLLVVVILMKCLIAILRAADFSLSSEMDVVDNSYSLPTAAIVLSVCSSTVLLVLEVLVALGWGLAFDTLNKGRIVILCLACMCGFVVYVAASTCPVSGWSGSFTRNVHAREGYSLRCRGIDYARLSVETFFHIFSAVAMVLCTARLGKIVGAYAATPTPPLTEEALRYFYGLRTGKYDDAKDRSKAGSLSSASSSASSSSRKRRAANSGGPRTSTVSPSRSSRQSRRRESSRRRSRSVGDASSRRGSSDANRSQNQSRSRRARRESLSSSDSRLNDPLEDGNTTREAAVAAMEKRRCNDVQLTLMKLYLRYRSMRAPFGFVVLWPGLFWVFSFTFYDTGDYYMQIFFEEMSHFYLLCFILLFMRKDSFYC